VTTADPDSTRHDRPARESGSVRCCSSFLANTQAHEHNLLAQAQSCARGEAAEGECAQRAFMHRHGQDLGNTGPGRRKRQAPEEIRSAFQNLG
jgi:hypothetical protein